jgi:hypothetical protein
MTISNSAHNAHTESLFKSAEVLLLSLLIDYFRIQFMCQFVHQYLIIYFSQCWKLMLKEEKKDQSYVRRTTFPTIPSLS